MNHRAQQHPAKEWINKHINLIPYVGLVLVMVFALALNSRNQKQDEKARCVAAIDSRNVQRATVEAIYGLAVGAVTRQPTDAPLTREETTQYNAYIDRANDFRENTYKLIKPSELCAPYVNDDNVRPPTPPAPPLRYKEVK